MAYLVQRGNSFHFRIRVPTDLRAVLGKSELRRSLGASNGKREARRKPRHLYVATDKFFDRLRAGEMLDVERALNAWVADRLHDYEVQRTLAGPLTEAQALEAQGTQVEAVVKLEKNLRLNRLSDYEDMTIMPRAA